MMKTKDIVEKLQNSYKNTEIKKDHSACRKPQNSEVKKIIQLTKDLVFPGYFTNGFVVDSLCNRKLTKKVNKLRKVLRKQILYSRLYLTDEQDKSIFADESCELCQAYFNAIPQIREEIALDVEAHYQGDPAAFNRDQVIISYPGIYAILIYRIAHTLDNLGVRVIPRMMAEFAHRETGIDINPKAMIGKSFFIDHGTGVVIGETAVIGDNVKIYQGVTLGAMSLRKGKKLKGIKRHPTIENDVTIYSNASILGGDTVIGENSVIGSNVLVMKSIPKNSIVTNKEPELELRSNIKNESI
ncbi:MAG: serine acetyltransferase [Tenericutes bacterium]|nr:serine acetyltransferase [Mycoplasmatota bacterium]